MVASFPSVAFAINSDKPIMTNLLPLCYFCSTTFTPSKEVVISGNEETINNDEVEIDNEVVVAVVSGHDVTIELLLDEI